MIQQVNMVLILFNYQMIVSGHINIVANLSIRKNITMGGVNISKMTV